MVAFSCVIAAKDEAKNIERCLAGVADVDGRLDHVVVVANCCQDDTAAIARRLGARVIETAVPGKHSALHLGDKASIGFPRIYLDADVNLPHGGGHALACLLVSSEAIAIAPSVEWVHGDLFGILRKVHRVHQEVIALRPGLAGAGCYVLSENAHDRVFPLPNVINDDGWVHRSFSSQERQVVDDVVVSISAVESLDEFVRRRVRVKLGNVQLNALGRPAPEGRLGKRDLANLVAMRRVGLLDALLYLSASLYVEMRARRLLQLDGQTAFNTVAW